MSETVGFPLEQVPSDGQAQAQAEAQRQIAEWRAMMEATNPHEENEA